MSYAFPKAVSIGTQLTRLKIYVKTQSSCKQIQPGGDG